jgi:uncharacterized protein (DUF433 family)
MSQSLGKTNLLYPPGFADRYVPAPTDDPEAFAMIVDGDCMEPDYRRGELVIFSPLEVQRYGAQNGKDYAIQLDGQAANESSFKRLFMDSADPSVFLLRCINPMYQGTERVARERVTRLARAVWVNRLPTVYIERHPDFRGGRARIRGTRITVDDIVILHRHLGQSIEEIAGRYDLVPASVHAAMTYYYDHKDEIDQLLASDDAFVEAFKQANPSRLQEKLKALGRG